MNQRKRTAIYGGTFDPVHLGHLEVARRVLRLFEIDEVLFVPAQQAPHKRTSEVTPALHRYAMLVLATQGEPQLLISSFELDAPNRRYTVDTLTHFQATFGGARDLFFLMGSDSWAEITSWREWERLLGLTNHIVVTRPGYEVSLAHVPDSVRERIVDVRGASGLSRAQRGREGVIFITDVVMLDIAASNIRQVARLGRLSALNQLVPRQVGEYITKYRLYRDSNDH